MDIDIPPVAPAKPPPLTSDQLSYLVWRYLQERGYGEAAVHLQRDWNLNPETLPFAPHVNGSALVKLVQNGLKYHHIQKQSDEHGRIIRPLEPSLFFFGPESEKPAQEVRDIAQTSSTALRPASPASTIPSKREAGPNGVHETTPQPAPKRSRKPGTSERNGSTGRKPAPTSTTLVTNIELNAPNGHPGSHDARSPSATEPPGPEDIAAAINGVHGEDRMDVDTDGEQQLEVAPEPPMLHTIVHGESRAIQVETKVADLGPSTTIISTPDRTNLSQVIWHPTDRSILSSRGDAQCGVWRAPSGQYQDLVKYAPSEETFVTAVAWEPQGRMLAVAVSSAAGGELHLYDGAELGLLETLSASQRMIMRLQWQKDGMRLVGLAPMDDENAESSVLLWDLSNPTSSPSPHCVTVPETLEDVDCAIYEHQSMVCASGSRAVYQLSAHSGLEVDIKWSSAPGPDNDNWSFVKCSMQGVNNFLVVAASSSSGRIWLPGRDLIHQAHQAPITGLQIRPQPAKGRHALSTTEFATCSMDGTIKAWNYDEMRNSLTTLCKLTLGYTQPLKALAYSPDGFCLSGASYSDARIWNAENGYNQMATWTAPANDWAGNTIRERDAVSNDGLSSVNGDTGAVEHSLSWDADSMKLAFSLTSQVAVINFQR